MQTGLTQLIHRKRYSLISVPDTSYDPYGRPGFVNAQQYSDSREGSPHSYPRNRSDATPLLTLPAPIAVSPVIGTPSGSSSLADAPYVRIADASMSVSPSTSDVPGDHEREPTLADSNSITSGRTLVTMGPNAVIRAAPGQTTYPGETPNPYRYSQPQMATYDQAPVPQVASYGYAPEPTMDEYQQYQHLSISISISISNTCLHLLCRPCRFPRRHRNHSNLPKPRGLIDDLVDIAWLILVLSAPQMRRFDE